MKWLRNNYIYNERTTLMTIFFRAQTHKKLIKNRIILLQNQWPINQLREFIAGMKNYSKRERCKKHKGFSF